MLLLAFVAGTGLFAQDFDRYSYYLVSDSIYETKDYTYLERDTVDAYGFIPLTGEDQFVQITDKPVFVARYDAKQDTLIYLYAYSAVYNIDPTTGEPHYWMGNWNPSTYSKNNNLGWDKAKNQSLPYMYLWWTLENYSAPEEYYVFHIDPGMYYVLLDKESMIDDDPMILFGKMDDLKPIPVIPDFPRIDYYKRTAHTYTTGGNSSSYGAINNFWSALYYINHGSSSSGSTTKTYYTWDKYGTITSIEDPRYEAHDILKDYYHVSLYLYQYGAAAVFYQPNDAKPYGVEKAEYDSRLETYWYNLVPYEEQKNWLSPEEEPEVAKVLFWDMENNRVCLVDWQLYQDIIYCYDFESCMNQFDWFYINYNPAGCESYPFSALDVQELIVKYEKYAFDPEGAKKLREYALNKEKSYDVVRRLIDTLYLNYDASSLWVPQFTEEKVKEYIDAYETVFNDPAGAQKLREYAFGANGIGDISADGKEIFYDLSGRRITNPSKGIYIRNGKKISYVR